MQVNHRGQESLEARGTKKSVRSPSRAYMELVSEWLLIHRSPKQLIELCGMAGIEKSNVSIVSDSTGVNLFLVARSN